MYRIDFQVQTNEEMRVITRVKIDLHAIDYVFTRVF